MRFIGVGPWSHWAPRQGWLNAFDGVFYRLGIATYGYADNFFENGHQHSGLLQFYLPFNRRFELRVDIPVNDRGPTQQGRIVDVSSKAARSLGFARQGLVDSKLEVVEAAKPRATGSPPEVRW